MPDYGSSKSGVIYNAYKGRNRYVDRRFLPFRLIKKRGGHAMAKAKEGDLYSCTECGMVVCVEDPCGCSTCELICCDVPMKKKAGKAKTARKKKAALKTRAGRK